MELRLFTTCDATRFDPATRLYDLVGVFNTVTCGSFPCDVRFVAFTEWTGTGPELGLVQPFYLEILQGDELVADYEGSVVLKRDEGVRDRNALEPSAMVDVEAKFRTHEGRYFRVRVLDADRGLLAEKRILVRERA
jgi:hypothetical protein